MVGRPGRAAPSSPTDRITEQLNVFGRNLNTVIPSLSHRVIMP